jgi:hypothetical protein
MNIQYSTLNIEHRITMGRMGFAVSMAAVAGLMVALATGVSAAEWRKVYETSESAAQELRGFGRVDVIRGAYESDSGKAWSTLFRCQSPLKASTLAGKFLADLRLSPGVEDAKLKVGEAAVPALTVPGAATFAVCVDGADMAPNKVFNWDIQKISIDLFPAGGSKR